ncbi:sensor histidine kinase [Actinomyces dentalis]|uniref:sensor histidine kinase n=1 Tax=Actinomyces dentalis TaxID=272548 RepID=UPI002354D6BF|nr:HAMP domain-containing sensor histidine kinase [Actinomyces dentalis]
MPARFDPAVRRRSLRARLVAGVLGLVLITSALVGAFSTLALRHTLMERLDEKLVAASDRAAARRHEAAGKSAGDDSCRADRSDDPGGADKPDRPVPAGLDAPGQSTGTLTIISSGAAGSPTVAAGYIDSGGLYQSLSEAETRALLSLEPTGEPVTVTISSLGDYRVVASRDSKSGDLVVTGLSMAGDNALVRTQLLIEIMIALLGATAAALAGRAMVRSSLAPLERVAATAERVASQPLASGEVRIRERVADADLDSSQEVGQVGAALNTLLGHVEEALSARQRSETQVRQFVADASHELRTPLASIRGYTELIAREGAGAALPEEATHALERVHSESVRMTGLVEDLLLLARLDAGRELRREEVDLLGVLLDTVADARAAGPDHVWELDLSALGSPDGEGGAEDDDGAEDADGGDRADDAGGEPPLVVGDEARLRQVLVNLLANARVHTPPGTRVTTRLSRGPGAAGGDADPGATPAVDPAAGGAPAAPSDAAGTWVITIGDDGPGIDPAVRDRIFERFARADASRERRTGSTGLGMSIALAIVTAHRGALTVDSVRAGDDPARPQAHGTTFTVTLPAS